MLFNDVGQKMEVWPPQVEVPVSKVSIRGLVVHRLWGSLGRTAEEDRKVNVRRFLMPKDRTLTIAGSTYHAPQRKFAERLAFVFACTTNT